jgi:hypothetical protein
LTDDWNQDLTGWVCFASTELLEVDSEDVSARWRGMTTRI